LTFQVFILQKNSSGNVWIGWPKQLTYTWSYNSKPE
jgi:hypothetical protein